MIEFKANVEKILPYDREKYIEFLDDDYEGFNQWYGVSFQLDYDGTKEMDLIKYVEIYDRLFKNIILKIDNGSFWIVNHDDKDLEWFPNEGNNLPSLRVLFKQNNIPNTFKGALVFSKDELLNFSEDLISYPYCVFNSEATMYKNLDISYSEIQFVIKIAGHFNIECLSTDKQLLRQIVDENSSVFFVRGYRGTNLDSVSE